MGNCSEGRFDALASTGNDPPTIDQRVGRRIKLRRLLLEIELHHLAGDLGILASSLARMEAGEERPEPALLTRMAGHLGVGADWFFRDFDVGTCAPEETQPDVRSAELRALAQRDVGSEMLELVDLFMQADAAGRQAILELARERSAKKRS
jgi:transcriptional regulator with XRE-family HTH domain